MARARHARRLRRAIELAPHLRLRAAGDEEPRRPSGPEPREGVHEHVEAGAPVDAAGEEQPRPAAERGRLLLVRKRGTTAFMQPGEVCWTSVRNLKENPDHASGPGKPRPGILVAPAEDRWMVIGTTTVAHFRDGHPRTRIPPHLWEDVMQKKISNSNG